MVKGGGRWVGGKGGAGGLFGLLRCDMPSSGSIGMGCVAWPIGEAKRLASEATW